MAKQECVFCALIAKKIPSTILEETADIIVIKDIAPKAPIHYLILPKKHIADIQSLTEQDTQLASDLLFMARLLSAKIPAPGSFKLVINNGASAGQHVFHLHLHFLAGNVMAEL